MQRLPGNHHMVPEINIMNGFLLKGESKEKKNNSTAKRPCLREEQEIWRNATLSFSLMLERVAPHGSVGDRAYVQVESYT